MERELLYQVFEAMFLETVEDQYYGQLSEQEINRLIDLPLPIYKRVTLLQAYVDEYIAMQECNL